jgi:hypothetical protein
MRGKSNHFRLLKVFCEFFDFRFTKMAKTRE